MVLAGIGVWAVALVVLLVLGDRVDDLWKWTCVAAIGLALMGLGVMRLQGQLPRHRRKRQARSDPGDGGPARDQPAEG